MPFNCNTINFYQRNDFWNEAINLSDLHHPNVVAFYGVVLDGPGGSVATVTEYMVNGSLRTALQSNERFVLDFQGLHHFFLVLAEIVGPHSPLPLLQSFNQLIETLLISGVLIKERGFCLPWTWLLEWNIYILKI